jgi:mannose/fructose/N-acetylgalactosamine-specific phosphotransferase system component IIC
LLVDVARVALLGGILAVDRTAGWNLMLGQPLIGACLAGAFLNPGPQWELWALRIPLGIGVLLQLLLTDASLPAAQRPRDVATAGVIGTSVALLGMQQLHPTLPVSTGGLLWVVVGTVAGLVASVPGGWYEVATRARNESRLKRVDECARQGRLASFEVLYWGSVVRAILRGAIWSVAGTALGVACATAVLPRIASAVTGPRIGLAFAVLLGVAFGSAFHAHVRGRANGLRWAAAGAATALVLMLRLGGGAP